MARSYHHLFPPPPTDPYYSDDEENEKESENEKSERNRKEKEIFDTIKPCVGCLEVPSSIEEARQFVYCTKCNCPLCQESGLRSSFSLLLFFRFSCLLFQSSVICSLMIIYTPAQAAADLLKMSWLFTTFSENAKNRKVGLEGKSFDS